MFTHTPTHTHFYVHIFKIHQFTHTSSFNPQGSFSPFPFLYVCLPSLAERTLGPIVFNRFSYLMNPPIYEKSIAALEPCLVEMPSSASSGSHSPCQPFPSWMPSSLHSSSPVPCSGPFVWMWMVSSQLDADTHLCRLLSADSSRALPHLRAVGRDCSGREGAEILWNS